MFRVHALQRMFEREIRYEEIIESLKFGEVIEEYPKDSPYPSQLILGWSGERPIHVVVANSETNTAIIITVYEPDPNQWDDSFKYRRNP